MMMVVMAMMLVAMVILLLVAIVTMVLATMVMVMVCLHLVLPLAPGDPWLTLTWIRCGLRSELSRGFTCPIYLLFIYLLFVIYLLIN